MSHTEYILTKVIEQLVMPPGCSILLLTLALLLRRFKAFCTACLSLGLMILYFSSLPATGQWLSRQLEVYPAVTDPAQTDAQAIVLLGGGTYYKAPEYGSDSLRNWALERTRYAAWLHRANGLPILTSGGTPDPDTLPEALITAFVLKNEFAADVRWVESRSLTTQENARFSCELLQQDNISRIFLVTHAWHMPRSVAVFEQCEGLTVYAAPTRFSTAEYLEQGVFAWLPRAGALHQNALYWHEILGLWWYHWRY